MRQLFDRQVKDELGSLLFLAFGLDISLVGFHNFSTNGQAQARPFVLGAPMKPLENPKNALIVFGRKANAVVFDRKFIIMKLRIKLRVVFYVIFTDLSCRNFNAWFGVFFAEFQSVVDEVLK